MPRFDTEETEKERRKREGWASGWRLNYDASNVKTPGVPNLKESQGQQQKQSDGIPVRPSKVKPIFYDENHKVSAIRPTPMATHRRKESEQY